MRNFAFPSTWRKEIISKSRKASIDTKLICGIIVLLFLLGVAVLNIIDTTTVLHIKDTIIKPINSFSALIALLFSLKLLTPVRDLYIPKTRHYRNVAFKIIEEFSQKKMVNPEKEGRLKNIAIKYLGALEDGSSQANPEGLLNQACTEMSEVCKDDRT